MRTLLCFLTLVMGFSVLGAEDSQPKLSILGKKQLEKNLTTLEGNKATIQTNLQTIEKNVGVVEAEMVKMEKLFEESQALIGDYEKYVANAKSESTKNTQAKEKITAWKNRMVASTTPNKPETKASLSQADEEMNNRLDWEKNAENKINQAGDILGDLKASQRKISVQRKKLTEELQNWKNQARNFRAELGAIDKKRAEYQKMLAEYK